MKAKITILLTCVFFTVSSWAQTQQKPTSLQDQLRKIQKVNSTDESGPTMIVKATKKEDSISRVKKGLSNKIAEKAPKRTPYSSISKTQQPKKVLSVKQNATSQQVDLTVSSGSDQVRHLKDDPQAREEFELLKTRDPNTGRIPVDIRLKELNFMRIQNEKIGIARAPGDILSPWVNRGPHNVGGRTRALAVDVNNENIILAGGVSGGMWRSVDQGVTWTKTTGSNELQSVSCIIQDTRNGQTDTWYYGTGEISGNSAGGAGASYRGDGIYKSTDNGQTWTVLSATSTETPESFDQGFDYNYEMVVNPTNGDLLVSNYFGVYHSTDGGSSFTLVLENVGFSGFWGDIIMTSSGKAFAVIDNKGVFSSTDGVNWTDITPASGFPLVSGERKELALASSNESIFYLIGEDVSQSSGHNLWKFNDATGAWTDLSANIPQLGGLTGDFTSQGGYDLLIKVKPDDENFVIIGGTNLFASTDGFASTNNTSWIGGYTANNDSYGLYANHHPDQHSFVFLTNNRAISGNDGGVQITNDITDVATNANQETVDWIPLNNGYLTTQVYALSAGPGDQIMAGFQDNSTWLTTSTSSDANWTDQFGGDGAYNAFNSDGSIRYMSSQNGNIYRVAYNGGADDITHDGFTFFAPDGYTADLFIVPFYLDPSNDDLFYLAGSSTFYVNTQASTGTSSIGWKTIDLGATGTISEIGVTGSNMVYVGTSAGEVFKIENPGDSETVTNVTGNIFPSGYVSGLGVNQSNSDEIFITFSNYSIQSVFYSNDGGANWSNVSGNLEENPDGSGSGPSVRTAQILGNGNRYFIGTSTGLYSTSSMSGDGTIWVQEDGTGIGEVVVEHLVTREDGLILAGTHGNGIYSSKFEVQGQITNDLAVANIISPKGPFVSGEESITATITNRGTVAQNSFEVTYFINDVEVASQTVTHNLDAEDTISVTFATPFDFSPEGEYNLKVEVSLTGDEVSGNNTATKFLVNAKFTGKYVLKQVEPTSSSVSTVFGNGYLFSPTGIDIITLHYVDENKRGAFGVYMPNFHNNDQFFEWTYSNGEVIFTDNQSTGLSCSTAILLGTADTPGTYSLDDDSEFTLTLKEDVSDDCGNGSTDVTFTLTKQVDNDLAVSAIDSPSGSEFTGLHQIAISILNTGIVSQSSFEVSYYINDELVSTESVSKTIEPGATLNHNFDTEYDFSLPGNYNIKAIVNLVGDENTNNNELIKSTEIIQLLGFEGPYLLEQLAPTTAGTSFSFANGYVFDPSGSTSVFIENLEGGDRQFGAIYLPAFNSTNVKYRFSLNGTETVFHDNQSTGIQCNSGILLGTADTQGTFDINNDGEFTLNIKEDVNNDCSAGAVDVAFRLTKVPEYHDLAVIDITNPREVFPNSNQVIQIAIHNFSNVPQDNFDVTYYVNNVAVATETFNNGINIGETAFYGFQAQYDFSTPGFYDIRAEVNLTSDEFRDNDSYTKSVQSLEPISTFPYIETFDNDAGNLPLGWDDIFSNWTLTNAASGSTGTGPLGDNTSGTGYYMVSSGQSSQLRTRHIDLSTLNTPLLTFYYHMYGTPTSVLDVRVNGNQVFSISGERQQNQSDAYKKASVNLAQFAGQLVNIDFITNTGPSNQGDIAIDDIGIMEAAEHDLALRTIMSPVKVVSGEESITATIVNLGGRAQTEFDVSYFVDGVEISTELFTDIIASGQSVDFTFSTPFDFSAPNDYEIRVVIDLPTDEVAENDEFSRMVSSNVGRMPFTGPYQMEQLLQTTTGVSASFGSGYLFSGTNIVDVDIQYVDATTRTISLSYLSEFGSPFKDYEFTMNNGEVVFTDSQVTDQSCSNGILLGSADVAGVYVDGDDSEFTLTIKEDVTNDCGSGTVDVTFILNKKPATFDYDLEITGITLPAQNIPLSRQAVGFRVQNMGQLPQGDFDATYYVNDVAISTEIFRQPLMLQAGNSRNFTFNTPYNFDALDLYDIKVVLSRAADDNPLNDEASIQIQTSAFNINAIPISNSRVGVEWVNLSDVTNVVLERSADGVTFEDLVSVSTTDTYIIDDAIDVNTVYSYRLRGELPGGEVNHSVIVSAQGSIGGEYAFDKVLGDITGVDLSNNTYSASWGDLDDDGDLDLVVSNIPNFNPNLSLKDAPSVYLNDGNGNFERAVNSTIVNDGVSSRSASIIDYNNDGKIDVFLSAYNSRVLDHKNRLFQNNGNLDFTSLEIPTFDKTINSEEGSWGDMDNDGDLDLFVAGQMFIGNPDFLYENLGDGRLKSIREGVIYETLFNSGVYTWGASWVDYDGDGDQDLFVPNDGLNDTAKMFRNLGDGTFEEDTNSEFVSEIIAVRGAHWADFDQDGSLDLLMMDRNAFPIFYFNDGAGNFSKKSSMETLGMDLSIHRISTTGDINNNGKLDVIFASNGYFVFESNNDQTFTLLENVIPVTENGIFAGISLGDMDNDGDLDMFRGNASSGYSYSLLYENKGNNNNWLHIELKGEFSNVDGIGSKIELTTGTDKQYRTVTSNSGLMGQNSLIAEFGLGPNTMVDNIKVTWPSGTVKEFFDIEANQLIEIDDSNAPTNVGLSNAALPENLPSGAAVGASFSVDLDADDQHTYEIVGGGIPGGANRYTSKDALSGNTDLYSAVNKKYSTASAPANAQVQADNDNFFIENGTIKASTNFDFETQSSYSVRVRTTDAFGNTFEKIIAIDILDVNEEIENSSPTDISLTATRINENEPESSTIGTLTANDADEGSTHTFSLVDGAAPLFEIDGNVLKTAASFNFEKDNEYSITIRTIDDGGLSFDKEYIISVDNVNEEPIELFLENTRLTEGLVPGSLVGMLSTADIDENDTHSYSLSGVDGESFQILGNELLTLDPLDFEAKNSYEITITTTDEGGLAISQDYVIEISDENDAPASLTLSSTNIAELLPKGSVIADLSTTDDDASDTHTYAVLGSDAAKFKIVGSELRTAEEYNFEAVNAYEITLTVTDNGGLSYSTDVKINITDANDEPTALNISSLEIPEEQSSGLLVGALSTVDEDISDSHSYTLVSGVGDDDNANFSIDGTQLKSAIQFDFETKSSYSIRVAVSDGNGGTFEKQFDVSIIDIDEASPNNAPSKINLTAANVEENAAIGTAVATLSTTDPDAGDSHDYFLVDGDVSVFSIDNDILKTNATFNFETSSNYAVTIRTVDAGGLLYDEEFAITIDNVNEAPTGISLNNNTLDEGLDSDTVIGTVSVSDEDIGDTYTLSISGNDASNFDFLGDDLRNKVAFDFENQSSYSITVTATDADGLSFNQDFSIAVNDLNEAPTEISLSTNSISEGESLGTVVGVISTTDMDANDSHTYNLTGTDASSFQILIDELRTKETFNFESKSSYDITVETIDDGGLSKTTDFTIEVLDANDAPTAISLNSTSINEGSASGSAIGLVTITDEDNTDTHTYDISGIDASNFTIEAGELLASSEFNFESKSNYNIVITATDAGGLSIADDFVITVSDVNEAPTTLALSNSEISEGMAANTSIGLLSFDDEDAADTHTISLSGTDASSFTVVQNELLSSEEFNFESKSTLNLTVTVTDAGGLNVSSDFVISVLDVNEAPTAINLSATEIDEGEDVGTVIGSITVEDEDQSDTHTLILSGPDASSFSIVGSDLQSAASFDVDQKSSFSISIEASDGELSTTEDFTISVNKVLSFDENDRLVKVYPNPSKGIFTIAIDPSWRTSEWKLFDLMGKEIQTAKSLVENKDSTITLDLRHLANGEYILKLQDLSNRQITKQLVINR